MTTPKCEPAACMPFRPFGPRFHSPRPPPGFSSARRTRGDGDRSAGLLASGGTVVAGPQTYVTRWLALEIPKEPGNGGCLVVWLFGFHVHLQECHPECGQRLSVPNRLRHQDQGDRSTPKVLWVSLYQPKGVHHFEKRSYGTVSNQF